VGVNLNLKVKNIIFLKSSLLSLYSFALELLEQEGQEALSYIRRIVAFDNNKLSLTLTKI